MPKWEIWRLKFSVILTPNLQNKWTIYNGIHQNTAHTLWPKARVLWGLQWNSLQQEIMDGSPQVHCKELHHLSGCQHIWYSLNHVHFHAHMCSPAEMSRTISEGDLPLPVKGAEAPSETYHVFPSSSHLGRCKQVWHISHTKRDTLGVHGVTGAGHWRVKAGKHTTQGMWDDIRMSQFSEKKRILLLDLLDGQERKEGST